MKQRFSDMAYGIHQLLRGVVHAGLERLPPEKAAAMSKFGSEWANKSSPKWQLEFFWRLHLMRLLWPHSWLQLLVRRCPIWTCLLASTVKPSHSGSRRSAWILKHHISSCRVLLGSFLSGCVLWLSWLASCWSPPCLHHLVWPRLLPQHPSLVRSWPLQHFFLSCRSLPCLEFVRLHASQV